MDGFRESDLRDWLKMIWGSNLQWSEPGFGSASGEPDVKLMYGVNAVPVELKVWEVGRKGIKCAVRPAQIRHHIMAARAGRRTALMVLLNGGEVGGKIYMLPGKHCPRDLYETYMTDLWFIDDHSYSYSQAPRKRIIKTLQDKAFWE